GWGHRADRFSRGGGRQSSRRLLAMAIFSAKSVSLAVQLGGTDLKSAVVNGRGKILHRSRISSGASDPTDGVLKRILSAVFLERDWADANGFKIAGAGLGIPGIVSYPQGIVHRSPHFPAWRNFPILKKLKARLPFFVAVENDATLAAQGEAWLGAGEGHKKFILLTLGTGIRGVIVLGGEIFRGDSGFAGEMGHWVIEENGRPCNCGGRGCLEMYASTVGLRADLKERNWKKDLSPEGLYRLALKGNATAKKIYGGFGRALGAGIASLVNALDIETVILGGGLAGAGKPFIPATRISIEQHTYPTTAKKIRLLKAGLGKDAGLVGAARSVFGVCYRHDAL